ncbi:hypothetical protein ACFQZI_20640 [Mucilaginibacter lutimaris]|uniref:Uncharacterized protein n=1 Tax=Mucilaginibacter lutimaris TaxID=931629 RepID=A0ABW2ZM37_9SPHI
MMTIATDQLTNKDHVFTNITWFFIIPWMLIAIFGGMGPPPETPAAWANLALEQIVRYSILIISGTMVTIGFLRLNALLANTPGKTLAGYGTIMISVALPLFIANMAYWGYFLTHVFSTYSVPGAPAKPGWLKTVSEVFLVIRMIEVLLIYLSTAAFILALRIVNHLSKPSTYVYVFFCCLGAFLNLLPNSIKGPLAIANYLSYIPAFTLLMPYLLAVNLNRKYIKNNRLIWLQPLKANNHLN